MRCKYCKCDPDPIILVPNTGTGTEIEVFSCRDCAVKHGVYCEKHERPHTGFLFDDDTACLTCVEEDVQATKGKAEGIFELLKDLPDEEWDQIHEMAEISSAITGDDLPISVYRFVMTKAHRLKRTPEELVAQVLKQKSSSLIASFAFF